MKNNYQPLFYIVQSGEEYVFPFLPMHDTPESCQEWWEEVAPNSPQPGVRKMVQNIKHGLVMIVDYVDVLPFYSGGLPESNETWEKAEVDWKGSDRDQPLIGWRNKSEVRQD